MRLQAVTTLLAFIFFAALIIVLWNVGFDPYTVDTEVYYG